MHRPLAPAVATRQRAAWPMFIMLATMLSASSSAFGQAATATNEPASPALPTDGLILLLDASAADTLTLDDMGCVASWTNSIEASGGPGLTATQPDQQRRPVVAPSDFFAGRTTVQFSGDQFLSLGPAPSLRFQPGEPVTIAAVVSIKLKQSGTILARGGGSIAQRAVQLYAAPGKHGAIACGTTKNPLARKNSMWSS